MDATTKRILAIKDGDISAEEQKEFCTFMDSKTRDGLNILASYFECNPRDAIEKISGIIKTGSFASIIKCGEPVSTLMVSMMTNEIAALWTSGLMTGIWFAIKQMKSNLDIREA